LEDDLQLKELCAISSGYWYDRQAYPAAPISIDAPKCCLTALICLTFFFNWLYFAAAHVQHQLRAKAIHERGEIDACQTSLNELQCH